MKEFAERIRDEITALSGVSYASVSGTRPFELSIEISEDSLRQYGLTLNQVAQVIRLWSVDIPGGTIRSDSGDIRLRAKGQAYTGQEFENILLLTQPDGTRIRLGDVATPRRPSELGETRGTGQVNDMMSCLDSKITTSSESSVSAAGGAGVLARPGPGRLPASGRGGPERRGAGLQNQLGRFDSDPSLQNKHLTIVY